MNLSPESRILNKKLEKKRKNQKKPEKKSCGKPITAVFARLLKRDEKKN